MKKAFIGGGAAVLALAVLAVGIGFGLQQNSEGSPSTPVTEATDAGLPAADLAEDGKGPESWDVPMGIELDGSVYGNAPGNTALGGRSNFYDDWIFCTSLTDYGAIYRMHPDGSGKQPLGISSVSHLSLYGGWLYYVGADGVIARIRPDGSGQEKVADFNAYYLNIVDGWMYFTRSERGVSNLTGEVWKMRPDGSGLEMLHEGPAEDMVVYGGWIYFAEPRNGYDPSRRALYRIGLEGGEVQLVGESVYEYVPAGDWIFYRSLVEEGMFKMRLDGSEGQKASDATLLDLCVLGDWVYYIDRVDASTRPLWRYNVETSEISLVSDMACFSVNAVGDNILVQEWPGEHTATLIPLNNRLYVADPDGSNMLLVDERVD